MIRLERIAKSYDVAGRAVEALSDIDLSIEAGEIFGVIGSSGAGKSTLVRLINLLERPTAGDVYFDGRRVTHFDGADLRGLRRKIGMVFQHFNLMNARTVAGNVAYPLQVSGAYGKAEIQRRVSTLLERVGLSGHADKYPRQLSGGQKQRVGIARALACDPAVLLCDEATSALDPPTTISVLDLLQEINRDLGVTIVMITHEMDVIRRACDRVAVLDHGRIAKIGPVTEVFLHPTHPATLALVREAEPEQAVELDDLPPPASGRLVRVTLLGAQAREPLFGRLARNHDVDYAILSGRVGHIRATAYAQFVLSVSGEQIDAALEGLENAGAIVEALNASQDAAAAAPEAGGLADVA